MSVDVERPVNSSEKDITDDEAKLYDRQIRLWGVASQKRLRKANVVCFGLSGLASEIIKNIVLAGINSLTIVDDVKISEDDTLNNIFTCHEVGKYRGEIAMVNIKALNPMVQVNAMYWSLKEKIANKNSTEVNELLKSADCVVVTNSDPDTMINLNDLCASSARPITFFAACDWGFYGFSFTDLGRNYKYITQEVIQNEIDTEKPSPKKQKTEEIQKSYVERQLDFVPLRTALSVKSGKAGIGITKRTSPVLALTHILFEFHRKTGRFPTPETRQQDMETLSSLKESVLNELELPNTALKELEDENCFENVFGRFSPISAIIGGVLGQDIIRAITNQDAPIRNFFLFDGMKCQGSVESIGK
ncbi:SUMO1 activating enzyme subunit 1 [Brevipalpus obovatus]|uniref:SUMO1 activating enzyme subunit 1 n=1 Tax=Brevipalpus obovatus TaxID=246614 RepID=UPI003D9EBAC5